MLLTFRSFADIPNKIHVFYEQAFETLFARHDALKDSFKRQFSTNLPIDVFKNQFSAFCLLTYDQEFYTFSEAQALEYIEKSKRITGLEFENSNFLKDLFESVCMLQRDGMSIVFCHRSFQEFFAARFIARLSREKTEKLLPKYLYRMSDGTGSMLYDMNNDLVEECFLVPKFLSFREKLVTQSKLSGIEKTCKALGCNCEVTVYKRINRADIEEFSIRFSDIEYTRFMDLVLQLFNVDLGEENQGFNSLIEKDATASAQLAKLKEFIPFFPDKSSFKKTVIYSNGWQVDKLFAKSLETAFKRGGYTVYRSLMAQRTRQLCESMMEARKSRNNSLDALLKI